MVGQTSSVIRHIVLLVLLATSALLWPDASVKAQNNSPAATTSPNEFLNTLSQQEREWLREHPVIRVFQDPDWPPIEFADERGNPTGMTKDYLSLIEQRLGQKFEPVLHLDFKEALAGMKRGEIDMTTSVAETPERLQYLAFTQPYMTIPIVIATQQNVTYISNLHELRGKKVAAVDGYAVHEWIQNDFPEVRLLKVKTSLEGLQRVERGEIDAFIDGLVTIGYHQTKRDVLNLKIAGATPYFNAQRMAVRKDWAPFAGILQKALDSITATERDAIFRKWLPLQYQSTFDYTRLWPVATILALVLLGLGLWNWKLAAEIRLRKQTEAGLQASEQEFRSLAEAMPQIVWITRPDGWTIYLNQQWVDYTGLTLEESYGHGWNKPFHPDDQQRAWDAWQNATQNDATYSVECRLRRADGAYRWWLIRGVPLRDASGKILKWFGTCTDIEEIKQAAQALQETQAMLARTEEIGKLGGWEFDIETLQQTWTKAVYTIHEIDFTAYPTVEQGINFYTPESRPIIEQAVQRAIEHGEPFDLELEITTAKGNLRAVHTIGRHDPVRGKIVGFFQDITERKQAALLLAESESQRHAEMSAALEVQNQSSRAALNLMEDAIAAQQKAESLGATLNEQLDDLLAEHGQPPRYPSALDEGAQE